MCIHLLKCNKDKNALLEKQVADELVCMSSKARKKPWGLGEDEGKENMPHVSSLSTRVEAPPDTSVQREEARLY